MRATMLIDEIRRRMTGAMRSGNAIEKEILRVALGEIQTAEARGGSSGDETAVAILRKLVKSNQETLALSTDAAQKATLEKEIAVLESLLPQTMGVDAIVEALAPSRDAIRAAGNDGQATGIAMKALKASGAAVSGKDVSEAVKRIRS
jgi:uncharacterized protein YqeY